MHNRTLKSRILENKPPWALAKTRRMWVNVISFPTINLVTFWFAQSLLSNGVEIVPIVVVLFREYTTLIKQPRFGNLSKSLPIVNMKISSPDSDLAPKL